jgi:hypothetical protein
MNKLLIYLLTAISAFAADLNFSSMENGDRVEITLHSTGCFHNTTSYYEVKKSADTCLFTQYAITWDKSVPAKMAEKKAIGELQLTKADIDGLDGLLRFYRGKKDASSTTYVTILVEYYEGGRQIRVENLTDGSGGFGLDKRDDATSFRALTARFHP